MHVTGLFLVDLSNKIFSSYSVLSNNRTDPSEHPTAK